MLDTLLQVELVAGEADPGNVPRTVCAPADAAMAMGAPFAGQVGRKAHGPAKTAPVHDL
jgi:hypothetical protein